jgi:hypothetical protein
MTYTVEGTAGIYTATVVVPEPGTVVMLAVVALTALLLWQQHLSTRKVFFRSTAG